MYTRARKPKLGRTHPSNENCVVSFQNVRCTVCFVCACVPVFIPPSQVLEVETVKLTPELRRRLPFLGHLPIHCDISFLELDMVKFVSEETTRKFQEGSSRGEKLLLTLSRRGGCRGGGCSEGKTACSERGRFSRVPNIVLWRESRGLGPRSCPFSSPALIGSMR